MTTLCCDYRVQHNRKVAAGRIFHTNRNIKTADHQTMFLIFYRTGTDRYIGKKIRQVVPVVRIKHFIGGSKTGFLNGAHMHMTDCQNTGKNIRLCFRIRLMQHALITFTSSTRFICIDSWN